ncbi:MAG: stage sporulation protein [Clostridiales bacterium]|nr:stage sporulation protein [Clostridiales bacterium]MDN5281655.1 stage sporulation protein [Candidatus Ozemobacter sp.]
MSAFAQKNYLDIDRLIRVGLKSTGKHKKFQLEPSNGYLEIFDNTNKKAVYTGKASYAVITYVRKGTYKITIDGKKNFLNLSGEMLFSPIGKPPNFMKVKVAKRKSRSYRGSIAIVSESSFLFAINQIDMEDYLKSVVPSEIFNRAPAPAMEAQAIAARTYAVRNITRHRKNSSYDLCDTVHCQAYTGIVKEIKAATSAVKNTEGKVLTFADVPANTVYHSNCGGILICSTAAWGGKEIPYLVSHRDGIKGQELFCNVGTKIKKKKISDLKLQKPVSKLIVRSYPKTTKKRYHKNFGHRVGMCQDGAIGMGAIGYSSRQILGFYYPGTRLVTLNYARPKKAPVPEQKPGKRVIKPEPIILAMKPDKLKDENLSEIKLEFPLNPTQLNAIESSQKSDKKSVIRTLKEVSESRESKKAGFRKVFWNPSQPDISKISTN